MNTMRKTLLLLIALCQIVALTAQKNAPKWLDKSRKAVVTLTIYDKDGNRIASGTGFFVTEQGEILAPYTIFLKSATATATDTEGKSYPITRMLGADNMYNVIRVKADVPKKTPFLTVAQEPQAVGAAVYYIPYSTEKQVAFKEGTIEEVTKLKEPYGYYKVSIPINHAEENAPMLTANGEVFGLAQVDALGGEASSYAVSAGYVGSLSLSSTDNFSNKYAEIGIQKGWPADFDQALVTLMFRNGSEDAKTYLETLNDFITAFPNKEDGYMDRASQYAYHRAELGNPAQMLDLAKKDMETALNVSTKKDEAYFNQSKLIFNIAVSDSTLSAPWIILEAMSRIDKAIAINPLPVYLLHRGDLHLYNLEFEPAYNDYTTINSSGQGTALSYYMAAKARENMPDVNPLEVLSLLDEAVNRCSPEMRQEKAQYILERVDWKMSLCMYAEAVADYDLFYLTTPTSVGSDFYFFREQAKSRAGDVTGALKDIQSAIGLDPEVAEYHAEEATLNVRLKEYDKALISIDKALQLNPDFAGCHRLRGVCYLRMEKKSEACEALHKAKELGDPQAERLINENCQ